MRFIPNWAYVQHAEHLIRREHDQWMRGAKLGVRYYTVRPIHPARPDLPWTTDEHGSYVFVKNGAFGLPNQLITADGTPSWRIWRNNGPFTDTPKPLGPAVSNNGPADPRGRAVAEAVHAGYLAEMRQLYPASAEAFLTTV